MLGFLRRRGGRGSALGAAVTGIPSGTVVPAPLLPPILPPTPPAAAAGPVARAVPVAAPVPPAPVPPAPVAPAPPMAAPLVVPVPSGPRVELGFRDGSRACLDPASEEAQALDELARLLAGRR